MATALIITGILLWGAAFVALFRRLVLAPALSFLALLAVSFAREDTLPLLPINNVILISWLSITIVVMAATIMQNEETRRSSFGMAYIVTGAVAGMAVGLLGCTVTPDITMRYSIMVVATIAGTFFGYLLFGNTPEGKSRRQGFFPYLMAKGFPAAITVMQLGVPLVLAIALYDS